MLARAMGRQFGYAHLDLNDFFWEPTDPPFIQRREERKRQHLLKMAISRTEKCVISGSLIEWETFFA